MTYTFIKVALIIFFGFFKHFGIYYGFLYIHFLANFVLRGAVGCRGNMDTLATKQFGHYVVMLEEGIPWQNVTLIIE